MRGSIGLKIFGLVALLSLLAAMVAWVNARQADDVARMLANVNQTYVPGYAALARANVRSVEQSALLRRLVIKFLDPAAEDGDMAKLRALVEQKGKDTDSEILAARTAIEQEIADPTSFGDKVLLSRLDTELEFTQRERLAYEAMRAQVMKALDDRDEPRVMKLLAELDPLRDKLNAQSDTVRHEMLTLLDQANRAVIDEQNRSVRYGIILLGAALAIGLLVAGVVTVNLVRPLRRLLKSANAVQQGTLDADLPVTTRDEVGELTTAFNQMVKDLRTKAQVRETFGRYLDPRIVEGLIERPELLAGKGERRVMTVVFSDLKGFTALGQGMMPVTLVNVINHYLATMSEPVRRNGGIIDKYVGDTIMAFWGPPFNAAHDQARLACEAALGQLEQLGSLRASLPEILGLKRGLPHLDMRIGIATGDMVVGNIGSAMSMSYTVMGDAVNLGSRLESANKIYGTHMLVSQATMEMAKDSFEFREVDAIVVVGRDEPEQVFAMLGRRGQVPAEKLELARRYAAALAHYRNRAWAEAEAGLRDCLALAPEDGPCRTLLGRIPDLAARGLTAGWNGAWQLAEK